MKPWLCEKIRIKSTSKKEYLFYFPTEVLQEAANLLGLAALAHMGTAQVGLEGFQATILSTILGLMSFYLDKWSLSKESYLADF